jgi:hypothetical protein
MFLTKNTAKTRGVKTSSEAQDRGWSVAIVWELRTSCHGNGVSKRQNPPFFWLHFVDWTKYRSRSSSYYTAQWLKATAPEVFRWFTGLFPTVPDCSVLFRWCSGLFLAVPQAFRAVPEVFRAVLCCSGGFSELFRRCSVLLRRCSGLFRRCSGLFRAVPEVFIGTA